MNIETFDFETEQQLNRQEDYSENKRCKRCKFDSSDPNVKHIHT